MEKQQKKKTETEIVKRFPSEVTMNKDTFLNDKQIDGELYNLLQMLSFPRDTGKVDEKGKEIYETVVNKADLPNQAKICEQLKIKTTKTLRAHFKSLVLKQYLIEDGAYYILPPMETMFLAVPLPTVKYLWDNCREHIVKIYIYLGQRYKYSIEELHRYYSFTAAEIGEHIGVQVRNNSRGYEIVQNALDLLQNSGLIEYEDYYEGQTLKKRLTNFSYTHKTHVKVSSDG